MDADIKAKWVEALRSGVYQQTTSMLRYDDGFCCLGVLADIRGCTWDLDHEPWVNGTRVSPEGDAYLLPDFAQLTPAVQERLATLNDSGATFDEIAVVIEREIDPLNPHQHREPGHE